MLIERRARAQERRMVPETIARFINEAAPHAQLAIKPVPALAHSFDPGRTPQALRRFEQDPDWRLLPLAARYPRSSTDRETATAHSLEWVTPGHPLFEALRRNVLDLAREVFGKGACFFSLQHEAPARIDFYRARVVDGLGRVAHERLFAVELAEAGDPRLCEPTLLGNLSPARPPEVLPALAAAPEALEWLTEHALTPFLTEVRTEREAEIERVRQHIELSLTELLLKTDEEIGRATEEVEQGGQGAEGRLAQAEARHADLLSRRERRRQELSRQQALTLQGVERLTSVLVLPHPERGAPEMAGLRPDPETEWTAMRVVMEHEAAKGWQVEDVHEKDLGYDLTSLDPRSGELRLIEVKGLGGPRGTVLLTPNERRVAEDRRDCYWLYVVTHCKMPTGPVLQPPIKDPGRFPWHEVKKVDHYWLTVDALNEPMELREERPPYGRKE
jgi:hypothetical protein